MKTLRSEWFNGWDVVTYVEKVNQTTDFLDRYGDWRVVEGLLQYSTGSRIVVATKDGAITVGECGNYVKLILPPEEPEGMPLDAKVDYLEAQLGLQEQREERLQARADRYEQALREIAAEEWMIPSDGYRVLGRMARETLDE